MANLFFTLRAKLVAGMIISTAVLLNVAIVSFVNNDHLAEVALEVAERSLPSVDFVIEADRDMQQAVIAERSMLFINADNPRFKTLQEFHEENMAQALQRVSKFAALAKDTTELHSVDEYKKRHAAWVKTSRRVVALAATDHNAAVELSFGDADKKFETARTILDELTEKELARAKELARQGEETAKASHFMILSFAGFGLLIFILITAAFPRLVVRPIKLLTSRLNDMASGEGDLTARLDTARHDELGLLAIAFNKFVENIQNLISEVSGSTSQVASAAEELQVVATDASDYIQKQSMETDQVATAVTEMTATIQEVARNADQAAVAAREVDSQAGEGRKMVAETIERIDSLAAAVARAGEVIHRLETDSQNIGAVLDVIRGIAEQTNLLALNAAIEAARAGEQGRGFAVVADEVRTLAGRTQQSTSEIQDMIERLQSAANEAVSAMKEGQSEAETTVGQAAKTSESLDAVTKAINAISDMNQQIATAAEEQSAVSLEIDKNVSNISSIGEQTAESARQTASSGTQLAQLAEQLQMLVGRFRV